MIREVVAYGHMPKGLKMSLEGPLLFAPYRDRIFKISSTADVYVIINNYDIHIG